MTDVAVLGATGYTGKLITRYLAAHPNRDSFKLGLAARSKSKLDQLVSDLNLSGIQTFNVDVTDDASIKALFDASQARVVLTTVGPYCKWGLPIARACAQKGVHYVDITGETPFVRDLLVELDSLAMKTKAVLIPSSGFDSLPSDALAYLSAQTLRSALKSMNSHALERVGVKESHTMLKATGGASGGSIATGLHLMETQSRKEMLESQAPDVLSPIKLRTPQPLKLVYSMPAVHPKRYGHFFPLSPHNVAIVHRTRGLLELNANKFSDNDERAENVLPVYAEDYVYSESWEASNRVTAFLVSLSIILSSACISLFSPLRSLVKRIVPQPGEGPSDEVLEKGWLEMENISVSTPLPGTGKSIITESRLRGHGHPGYALTAIMASEVALALLEPAENLPPLVRQGGLLTPMSALGPIILKRLSATGKFEFETSVREEGAK